VLDEKVQDPTTGIFMPPVYRQHSNKGIVVTIGQWVVLGGKQIPLGDIIKVGDKILFGEYNCEKFTGVDGVEYELVRVQDIRGVERLVEELPIQEKKYYSNGMTSDSKTVIFATDRPEGIDSAKMTTLKQALYDPTFHLVATQETPNADDSQ
jgi:co-chaperonin GroES (HSP10)